MTAVPASGTVSETGTRWWSRRFIALLESFGLGSRLERGLQYAREGHVIELDVEPGIVLAKVEGSRFTPYRVRIRPKVFSDAQWRRAEKVIAARAATLARLLAGELPDDIEAVLADAKLALLPTSYEELRVSCTCPDKANPCKHAAAVYYVLASRFDADPFALLTLRGRTSEELIEALRVRRASARHALGAKGAGREAIGSFVVASGTSVDGREPVRPLAESLERFWRCGEQLARLDVTPLAAERPDALLRRLGPLPTLEPQAGPGAGAGAAEDAVAIALLGDAYAAMAVAAERRALSA